MVGIWRRIRRIRKVWRWRVSWRKRDSWGRDIWKRRSRRGGKGEEGEVEDDEDKEVEGEEEGSWSRGEREEAAVVNAEMIPWSGCLHCFLHWNPSLTVTLARDFVKAVLNTAGIKLLLWMRSRSRLGRSPSYSSFCMWALLLLLFLYVSCVCCKKFASCGSVLCVISFICMLIREWSHVFILLLYCFMCYMVASMAEWWCWMPLLF